MEIDRRRNPTRFSLVLLLLKSIPREDRLHLVQVVPDTPTTSGKRDLRVGHGSSVEGFSRVGIEPRIDRTSTNWISHSAKKSVQRLEMEKQKTSHVGGVSGVVKKEIVTSLGEFPHPRG